VTAAPGSWGGQRPSLAPYFKMTGPKDGATAAGGRSYYLSSRRCLKGPWCFWLTAVGRIFVFGLRPARRSHPPPPWPWMTLG